MYKLLTDRGKKEVARPNQQSPPLRGEGRQTRVVRENLQEPEEKGTCSFAAKSLQASRTTRREKKVVEDCSCIYRYICSLLRQLTKTVSRPRRGDNSIPTNPECPRYISTGVSVITLHKSWRGVEPMRTNARTVPLQTALPSSPNLSSPLPTLACDANIFRK